MERNKIEVIWKDLVTDLSLSCLSFIALEDGYGVEVWLEDDYDKMQKKEPFIVDFDICKNMYENSDKFRMKFYFKDSGTPSVKSRYIQHKVPDYLQYNSTPPYCVSGENISLAVLENMIVPSIYRSCITSVEICECLDTRDDCMNGNCVRYGYQYDDHQNMIVERSKEVGMLRLQYSRVSPSISRKTTRQIFLSIEETHCDKFFTVKRNDENKATWVVFVIVCLVSLVITATVIVIYKRMKRGNETEEEGSTGVTDKAGQGPFYRQSLKTGINNRRVTVKW